jgi:translation elongation factor EF-Ts
LNASDTGWEATLKNQQLSIKAVNPMVVDKDEVCVLWIKKGGQIFKVTELPNNGVKNIILGKIPNF